VNASSSKPGKCEKAINLNLASAGDLERLPGIGKKLAQRIIAERERKPFARVEELHRVSGIGPVRMEQLRALVTVDD
jgi:competence protein ComEA